MYIQEERRRTGVVSEERFDRIAFAMHALKVLQPTMRVAVYEGRWDIKVERGRASTAEPSWAMVSIPAHATREHIALALAELSGLSALPWVVEALVAAGTRAATAVS